MFKKLVFKLLLAAGIMFGLSSYVGYLYTGQLPPFLSGLRGVLPTPNTGSKAPGNWTDIGSMQGKTVTDEDGYQRIESGKTTIYKWQDAKGHWHFDGRKPPDSVNSQRQEIVNAPVSVSTENAPVEKAKAATSTESAQQPALANPYSPDGVKEIMNKAKEARQLMDDHTRRTEQM